MNSSFVGRNRSLHAGVRAGLFPGSAYSSTWWTVVTVFFASSLELISHRADPRGSTQ